MPFGSFGKYESSASGETKSEFRQHGRSTVGSCRISTAQAGSAPRGTLSTARSLPSGQARVHAPTSPLPSTSRAIVELSSRAVPLPPASAARSPGGTWRAGFRACSSIPWRSWTTLASKCLL